MLGDGLSPLDRANQEVRSQWKRSKGRAPPEKALHGRDPPPYVSFCGHRVSLDRLSHILCMAGTGGGKSFLLTPTIATIAKAVTADPTRRLLIVATKDEQLKWIRGARLPHALVTFTYAQGRGWQLERDFRSAFQIGQLSNYLYVEFEGDNAFWNRVGRNIHTAICISLKEVKGGCSLADQLRAVYLDDDSLRRLLNASSFGRRVVATYLSNHDTEMLGKFRSQVASGLERFLLVAGKGEISHPFSLDEFFNNNSLPPIAVVQLNPQMQEVERPLATSLIRRAFELMMSRATTRRKDRVVVIDDLNFYKKIPQFVEASELVRAQGGLLIALAQSFEGLKSKQSYGDEAAALLNNFPFQVYLGTNSGEAAEWCASRFGKSERFEESFGRSFGGETVQGREDRRRSVEGIINTGDLLNIPPPSPANGFTFHLKTPLWGTELHKHIPWHQVLRRHPPMGEATLTTIPEAYQEPAFWTQKDVEVLLSGKPSRVNPDVSSSSAIDKNLALFEEELMRCFHDLVQLGDIKAIHHLSKHFSDHNKE